MYSTTKLSITCETAVEPVARSQAWRSPVRLRMRWNTYTSTSWPIRNATSEPQMIHMPWPKIAANAVWRLSTPWFFPAVTHHGAGARWIVA